MFFVHAIKTAKDFAAPGCECATYGSKLVSVH